MEDALSLADAADAALRYRVVRTPTGVCVEPGTANDHLFDLKDILVLVRSKLENGDLVSIVV